MASEPTENPASLYETEERWICGDPHPLVMPSLRFTMMVQTHAVSLNIIAMLCERCVQPTLTQSEDFMRIMKFYVPSIQLRGCKNGPRP